MKDLRRPRDVVRLIERGRQLARLAAPSAEEAQELREIEAVMVRLQPHDCAMTPAPWNHGAVSARALGRGWWGSREADTTWYSVCGRSVAVVVDPLWVHQEHPGDAFVCWDPPAVGLAQRRGTPEARYAQALAEARHAAVAEALRAEGVTALPEDGDEVAGVVFRDGQEGGRLYLELDEEGAPAWQPGDLALVWRGGRPIARRGEGERGYSMSDAEGRHYSAVSVSAPGCLRRALKEVGQ